MNNKKKEQLLLRKVDKKLYKLYKFYAKRNLILKVSRTDFDTQIITLDVDVRITYITFQCLIKNGIRKNIKVYIVN